MSSKMRSILVCGMFAAGLLTGCGGGGGESAPPPATTEADIIKKYNLHVSGDPVVKTISLSGGGWELVELLCQRVGYSLAPYAGRDVTLVTYSITERWYSPIPSDPGSDLYLRLVTRDGVAACGYLSVRENSTAVPGLFALNDPNVK